MPGSGGTRWATLRALSLALPIGVGFVVMATHADDALPSCALYPVLIENFDTLSVASSRIGPARWTAHTPWSGDFGDAQFIDPGPDLPFRIKDGTLEIIATHGPKGWWTSGLLAAADATGAGTGTRYGYFEARMKMPPGSGTWPAFWLSALKPVTQTEGNVEIDVIEYYGKFTGAYRSTIHVWYMKDKAKTTGTGERIDVPDRALVESFHTYGVDLSPQAIVFYFDRKEVWRTPTPAELTGPMYPIVNLGLGGGWPIDATPDPSTLLVDYVHVHGRSAGPAGGCTPGPVGLD